MDLLADLRVRVIAHSPAAAYAGWLLRQFGAAVDMRSALDPEGLGAFLAGGAVFDPAPGIPDEAAPLLITDVPVSDAAVAAGFWVGEEREPVGFHLYPALAIRAGGEHVTAHGPAPLLGQHTAEVLRGLGLSEDELRELEAAGVTGTMPVERARA